MANKMYGRRKFLKTALTGASGLALSGMLPLGRHIFNGDQRPNIVLIMADDLGFSDLGCYGGEIETPNLDMLARNGMRFSQFYNYARCCPTRASLLTGVHPHQAGIGHMTSENQGTINRNLRIAHKSYQGYLNRNSLTLAEALGLSGYQTFMAGKWHVGTWRPNWPVDRGFDRYYGIVRGASNHFRPQADRMLLSDDQHITDLPDDFYSTDYFASNAAKFIRESDSSKPFFLYTAFTAPHWPLHAWPEDIEKYRGKYMIGWDEIRDRRYQRQKEMNLFGSSVGLTPRNPEASAWNDEMDKEEWDLRMAVYAAMVDRLDQGVGKIINSLKAKGEFDNTLILFLSDNGACAEPYNPEPDIMPGPPESDTGYFLPWANASNTPFRLFKHWTHEGGICTPLVAHWPKGIPAEQAGTITHEMANILDFMPTFLDVAEANYPDYYNNYKIQPLEGQSFLSVLKGEKEFKHKPMFWEHEGNRAVRDGKWKLVSYYGEANQFGVGNGERTGHWELYNMEEDRVEMNNVIDDYPDVARQMVDSYHRWAGRVDVLDWEEVNRRIGRL